MSTANNQYHWKTHPEMRRYLYQRLIALCGRYRDWSARVDSPFRQPPSNLREALQTISVELNELFGQSGKWSALEQQLAWAVTDQSSYLKVGLQFVDSLILNRAAALEVGFLHSNDLVEWSKASECEYLRKTVSVH